MLADFPVANDKSNADDDNLLALFGSPFDMIFLANLILHRPFTL